MQGLARVVAVGGALPCCQPAKHQQVVLAGVVVMRGQLVVDQVGNVQVDELQTTSGLQQCLHCILLHFKLTARTGQPQKALRRKRQLRQACRGVELGHHRGLDVKNTHGGGSL
jgi:hypothetical protein